MVRISLIATLIICVSISLSIPTAHGQEKDVISVEIEGIATATIRGEVVEASPEQIPIEDVNVTIVNTSTGEEYTVTTDIDGAYVKTGIPAGRYTTIVAKKGYGNRIVKPKVVAAGGEIFGRIRMIKNETITTFFLDNFFTWQLLVGFAIGFFVASILNSRPSRG